MPVWGTASEGEKVTVTFAGQKLEAVTKAGRWMIWLEPMRANATPQTLTISGANTRTFTNVLIGEVWLCSGQSNMERKMPQLVSRPPQPTDEWPKDAALANYPLIRHLVAYTATVPKTTYSPAYELRGPACGRRELARHKCNTAAPSALVTT